MIVLAPKVTHIVAQVIVHGEEKPDLYTPLTKFYFCGHQAYHPRPYHEAQPSEHWPVCSGCEEVKEMHK